MSPEEMLANLKDTQAKVAEEDNEALVLLKQGDAGKLTPNHLEEIQRILDLRRYSILNLTGLIDEYRAMPCKSLFAKFDDATRRYGRLV